MELMETVDSMDLMEAHKFRFIEIGLEGLVSLGEASVCLSLSLSLSLYGSCLLTLPMASF